MSEDAPTNAASERSAAEIARALGLPDDASEDDFRRRASALSINAQTEHHFGNHVDAAGSDGLSKLALQGAERRRDEQATRIVALLSEAAREAIPVDARVITKRDAADMHTVGVYASNGMVASATHPDRLTAASNAARALLAREGAEGSACNALRRLL